MPLLLNILGGYRRNVDTQVEMLSVIKKKDK